MIVLHFVVDNDVPSTSILCTCVLINTWSLKSACPSKIIGPQVKYEIIVLSVS
ncbi:hypothetical protein CRE_11524 [Caenorhabditis remanei]|uniref:Uncharacterized protein n=1 Tax=Caenorhabditis remanei TaxID=31234 RepID=E3NKS2_CAERE|nr:hypothetical protein CRE_11524 [Caenorhabditis remanei]